MWLVHHPMLTYLSFKVDQFFMIPKSQNKSGVNRRASQNKRSGNNVGDAIFMAAHHQSGRALVDSSPQDLTHRPPINRLSVSIPKQILNQIVWLQTQATTDITTSSSVTTPLHQTFSLANTNIASQVSDLFDQFSIYAVSVSFVMKDTDNAGQLCRLTSSVDFDGQSFLSPPTSLATLNAYATSLTTVMTEGTEHYRFLKPCCAGAVFQSSGSAFTSYATERLWVDSALPSTVFYGLLAIAEQNSGAPVISCVVTYSICCRNNN